MEIIGRKTKERLVVIPTYNEAPNIHALLTRLLDADLQADFLFVDDSSPDGTGRVISSLMAEHPNIRLMERPGKSGIGSALRDGILLGYQEGYSQVATMDADLTHAPSDLKRFFGHSESDVVIGSRFKSPGGLPGWSLWRRFLTHAGHILTQGCLGIPYDATGSLRVYQIRRIPRRAFELSQSDGYAFLFESLLILALNGFSIREIPIILPGRVVGKSKLRASDIRHSLTLLLQYLLIRLFLPERLRLVTLGDRVLTETATGQSDEWDDYWGCRLSFTGVSYDILASFYRRIVIRPPFETSIRASFPPGAKLLHAGCGTGQVDSRLQGTYKIIGLDHSPRAIELFLATNGETSDAVVGSILAIPFADSSFEGIYNLGVMEHFSREEIVATLREFHRVLTPDGKLVIWWPPEHGSFVILWGLISKLLQPLIGETRSKLFPDECSRVQNRAQAEELFGEAGFVVRQYSLGVADLYTQVLITAEKAGRDF